MSRSNRRRFIGGLASGVACLYGAGTIGAEASPGAPREQEGRERRRLGAALRELNESAGMGIQPEDLSRAEGYATGALLEAQAKLRPLVLDERLEPPVFSARRRS